MKNQLLLLFLCSFLIVFSYSCKKTIDPTINHNQNSSEGSQFVKYIIHQGQHYADDNAFIAVAYDELKFIVKFDSTCVYKTLESANQEDINKLYGFSDNNNQHQQFSARFGWNWARGALRLYAYVYNNGERSFQEITSIQIGAEYNCSIKVAANHYIFSVNNTISEMLRNSTTLKAVGYKLYPYFGGDETAPHDVDIWIKEL